MGAGKTTIGRGLAKRLGWDFVDADAEIERRSGVEVARIFEKEGEPGFRRRECFAMEDLTFRDNIVLATGGGAVLNTDNRIALRERGFVIYLNTPVEVQLKRTSRNNRRPLLQVANPRKKLQELFDERDPLYREVADEIVFSSRDHPKAMIEKLVAALPAEWRTPKRAKASRCRLAAAADAAPEMKADKVSAVKPQQAELPL